jgi:DNA polymerase V
MPIVASKLLVSTTLNQKPISLDANLALSTSPLSICKVQAGFPSPALDYTEDALDLNQYLIKHKAASFMFSVEGQSMRDAGIVDGDKVVVDRSVEAKHNNIVIAVVEGDYTIKQLYKRRERIELRAENPAFQPIVFTEFSKLEIWGVVVGVVRRYSH